MDKKLFSVIGICLGAIVGAMVFSEINTALASIKQQLHASVTQLQWIMNIFGIAICSTVVTFGKLADLFGRKRLYLIGIIAIGISMLGSGLAPNVNWIIFFQIILGLSGAIAIPVSQALISSIYFEHERSKAIGIWATVVGLAMAAGPILAGVIISVLNWRWVFLLNIPIILASFVMVILYVPESRDEKQNVPIDYLGALLLIIMIASFVLAIVQGHIWSYSSIITLYFISLVSLIALLVVEHRARDPIIREDLFKNRNFLAASLGNFCLVAFVWAGFFLIPLYLQTVHHYKAYETGLLMLFATIPLAIFSFVGGVLFNRLGPKRLILLGFVFLIISAALQMYYHVNSSLFDIALGTLTFGIGWGLIWGPTTTTAISTLPAKHAGIASGSFVTLQEIGGTVGLAVTVTVVRLQHNFILGFHAGMEVLLFVAFAGLIIMLFLKKE